MCTLVTCYSFALPVRRPYGGGASGGCPEHCFSALTRCVPYTQLRARLSCMEVHSCSSRASETEAGGSWVQGEMGLKKDPVSNKQRPKKGLTCIRWIKSVSFDVYTFNFLVISLWDFYHMWNSSGSDLDSWDFNIPGYFRDRVNFNYF